MSVHVLTSSFPASNILDVPNFFWETEPTLHPLYMAVREYLEIERRTRVLNERCRVFLELAEILSSGIADAKMSSITWIIIVLIAISIFVTVTEVVLRFAIISSEKNKIPLVGGGTDPVTSLLLDAAAALPPGCVCPSTGAAATQAAIAGWLGR